VWNWRNAAVAVNTGFSSCVILGFSLVCLLMCLLLLPLVHHVVVVVVVVLLLAARIVHVVHHVVFVCVLLGGVCGCAVCRGFLFE
jgi:hypothetical protein